MEGTRGKIGSYKWSGREKGGGGKCPKPQIKKSHKPRSALFYWLYLMYSPVKGSEKKKTTQNKQLFDTRSCFALKNTETHFTMEVGIP